MTSIVASMRRVISSWSGLVAASLACGGTGLAGIGQLADIAIVQGPLRWARRAAHSRDRSRDVPAPRSLPPAPGRLGGELGAGSDVKLGEHVREMGLHRPA